MSNLFENISDKNILKLKRILRSSTIKYPKNVNILSNVNHSDSIGVMDYGKVQLVYTDYEGNKIVLEELNEGDIIGTLNSSIYLEEITGMTKEETQITFIEYNQITNDDIIKYDFYIIFIKNLIRILTEQLKSRNTRIELLTKKSTRDKLLAYFKLQSQVKKNKTYTLPMSYTEISSYLSVDRSAMTREIKYLTEEGFIKKDNKQITINY
ncbi:MAG: Crp/Fnr family transcriptional regulator [Bacilli bacterium]|nr:Crp/Fnr family transcriptional regulator [Bacilli bacterium]